MITASQPMRRALALCRSHFIAAAVFSAFVNLLYVVPTIYMLQVYDRVVPTEGRMTLGFLTLVVLFAIATLALLDRVRSRLLVRAGVRLDAALAPVILDATIGCPDTPAARQALREFDLMRQTLTGAGILALFDAPWTPIYVLVCFLVHPLIGAVALGGAVILPVIAWRNEKATRPRLESANNAAAAAYVSQDAALGAAETVRSLGMRGAMVARQMRHRETMMRLQTEASFAANNHMAAARFVRLALQSLALGLGALLAIQNQISAGAIFASSFLIARALAPAEQLIGVWRNILQARGSYRNLDALLVENAARAQLTRLPVPSGAVRLEKVTIVRDEDVILKAIDLDVAKGEAIAIVGPSGAGKSTLMRAIVGGLLPDRGVIRFDGADRQSWDPERLARHIGYLPQDSALFAGTITENICRFMTETGQDTETIDAQVVAAATAVGAHELILRLSGGYDHRLHTGGRGLAAGQAQRVALARAVYGEPNLLVLDEPNAHLDAEGDRQLLAALGRLKARGTTILIASHKLSIMPIIDRILVLRDGRVVSLGPRDTVIKRIMPTTGPQARAGDSAMSVMS